MPRVNRDLQRRMTARRERERRPVAQRYRFAVGATTSPPADDALAGAATPAARQRLAVTDTTFAFEYGHVAADLRRIVVVIGALLVLLAILWFVLRV